MWKLVSHIYRNGNQVVDCLTTIDVYMMGVHGGIIALQVLLHPLFMIFETF